jgi:hypothetical protein
MEQENTDAFGCPFFLCEDATCVALSLALLAPSPRPSQVDTVEVGRIVLAGPLGPLGQLTLEFVVLGLDAMEPFDLALDEQFGADLVVAGLDVAHSSEPSIARMFFVSYRFRADSILSANLSIDALPDLGGRVGQHLLDDGAKMLHRRPPRIAKLTDLGHALGF